MIDQRIKETGQYQAKKKALRGGFSEYVEQLIASDLKKNSLVLMTKTERDIATGLIQP